MHNSRRRCPAGDFTPFIVIGTSPVGKIVDSPKATLGHPFGDCLAMGIIKLRSGRCSFLPFFCTALFPYIALEKEGEAPKVDYRHVEKLFDMLAEYFHNKPPPEEEDGRGEWVRVRDGLQGAEHCIRVLTPEEFEDWHRCIETPIQVEFGRTPVAFCSHEGDWWVIYDDTDENDVIARFEKCFESPEEPVAVDRKPFGFNIADMAEISNFFGMLMLLERNAAAPPRFRVAYDSARAEFSIGPTKLLAGYLPPRALSLVTEWASLHEKDLLAAWQDQASGREPRRIKPLE